MAKPTVSETQQNRKRIRIPVHAMLEPNTQQQLKPSPQQNQQPATFARPQNLMKSDYKHDR